MLETGGEDTLFSLLMFFQKINFVVNCARGVFMVNAKGQNVCKEECGGIYLVIEHVLASL